jgi:hypothetical protein
MTKSFIASPKGSFFARFPVSFVVLLMVLFVVLFIVLEMTARVYLFGFAGLDPRRVGSVHPIGETGFLRASDIPGLHYESEPNVDTFFKLASFRTNSVGLRDSEYLIKKPAGVFRIAVLGGSYAVGVGVEIESTFHSVMERGFNEGHDPPRFEIINFAMGGYLPMQLLSVLRHRALAYEPDLVLVSATELSAGLFTEQNPPRDRSYKPREPTNRFFDSFLWRLIQHRRGVPSVPPIRADRTEPSKQLADRSVLETLGQISSATGIPIVIVRLEYVDRRATMPDRKLRKRASRYGLYHVDTRAGFRGTDRGAFQIYRLDRHPNAAAHAIFAEQVGDFLASNHLLGQS